MAPRRRATQQSQTLGRQTKQSNQLSHPHQDTLSILTSFKLLITVVIEESKVL